MSIFEKMKNPRSKNIDVHIDCDVLLNDQWIPYTTTPTDSISKEAYLKLRKQGNVSIAPSLYHDWVDGKWVDASERYNQMKVSDDQAQKVSKLTELTSKINALSDKIEFGMSTNIDEDKNTLLSLRKERASLV